MINNSSKKWFLAAKIILGVLLIFSTDSFSQTFVSSNLPIVVISTDTNPVTNQPIAIVDDPRVLATMKIIKRPDGTRNYLTDINTSNFLDYNGRIDIEFRGSSSQSLPKKPYGLTTLQADNLSNNNVSLLGMPKENDWILNSLAFDPSLIRDYLSYNLSRQMGNYAPRTVYCEVVINNEYKGLYILQEKIKSDSNRVNVLKITNSDISDSNLTGGYITKADKTTGGDPVAWTMSSYKTSVDFIHELPKPEDVTVEQNDYIYNNFMSLSTTSRANNTSFSNGYPSVIDVPSFIDFMISNELASNADGYQFSTYFHKDRDGKLRAGPIWDFNLTYNNELPYWWEVRSKTDVWQFSNGDNEGAKFWTDLFNSPNYKCYMSKRWNTLTNSGQPLNYSSIVAFIDNTVNTISEAAAREHQKWGTVSNFTSEINKVKTFLSSRISWMTTNLGAYTACNSVQIPSLVITKINYNPKTTANFTVSNDLEFIEIKNTGLATVDLTGIYLSELGLSYSFPSNATLSSNESVFLASNSTVFQSKYGAAPFGQFTRNLSNSSQKLVLADAMGNIIDTVEYFDKSPWPDADGNGSYLELISTSLDNNIASSWIATDGGTLSNSSFSQSKNVSIFPNPVTDFVTVHTTSKEMQKIQIYDSVGTLVYSTNTISDHHNIDFKSYSKGVYIITVSGEKESVVKKIIKN